MEGTGEGMEARMGEGGSQNRDEESGWLLGWMPSIGASISEGVGNVVACASKLSLGFMFMFML